MQAGAKHSAGVVIRPSLYFLMLTQCQPGVAAHRHDRAANGSARSAMRIPVPKYRRMQFVSRLGGPRSKCTRTLLSASIAAVAAIGASCSSWPAHKVPTSEILAKVHPGHPRLLMTSDTIAIIKSNLSKDVWLLQRYRARKEKADKVLAEPPSAYQLKKSDGLLDISR